MKKSIYKSVVTNINEIIIESLENCCIKTIITMPITNSINKTIFIAVTNDNVLNLVKLYHLKSNLKNYDKKLQLKWDLCKNMYLKFKVYYA